MRLDQPARATGNGQHPPWSTSPSPSNNRSRPSRRRHKPNPQPPSLRHHGHSRVVIQISLMDREIRPIPIPKRHRSIRRSHGAKGRDLPRLLIAIKVPLRPPRRRISIQRKLRSLVHNLQRPQPSLPRHLIPKRHPIVISTRNHIEDPPIHLPKPDGQLPIVITHPRVGPQTGRHVPSPATIRAPVSSTPLPSTDPSASFSPSADGRTRTVPPRLTEYSAVRPRPTPSATEPRPETARSDSADPAP